MLESKYKTGLCKRIEDRFPGCVVIINNPNLRQGITDLLVLIEDFWGALEVKRDATAPLRPNQAWYVEQLNKMSFAAFIYPENEEEVLDDLQYAFESRRHSRVSES